MTILQEAESLINGPRQDEYGPPDDSFRRIASLWSDYLNFAIGPRDVAVMMVLLKLCRLKYSCYSNLDSAVDAAGYIGLLEKIS